MSKAAITLYAYLKKHKLKQLDFCRLTGVNRFTLHNYLRGSNVKAYIARRIEEKTQGQIKVSDLIDKI